MDTVKQWWNRNWSGLLAACILTVFFYAMTSWVRDTVTDQLKNYVPLSVWSQWANERSEWRGKVEEQIDRLEKQETEERTQVMSQLQDLKADIKILTTLLQEHKKENETKRSSP